MEVCDFVDFSLAVKLKEKGFRESCLGWYYPSEVCGFDYKTTIVFNNSEYRGCNYKDMLVSHKDEKHIDAPTISQVLKWLREEKKIYVSILPLTTHSTINKVAFYYLIEYNSTGETMTSIEPNNYCVEWKDAAVAGISHVLDNLI